MPKLDKAGNVITTPVAPVSTLPNRQPLRAGQIIAMTPAEEAMLGQVNWKPGDQVSGNIADIIARESDQLANAPDPIMQLPGAAPVEVPEPIRFEDLSPAKQAELSQAMLDAQKQMADFEDKIQQPRGPGIKEAFDTAIRTAHRNVQRGDTMSVVDDRVPPVGKPVAAAEVVLETIQPPAASSQPFCPHCGWDMKHQDGVVPERIDKLVFQQAILGGQRFVKSMPLMGGAATVVFRGLNEAETRLIRAQLRCEVLRADIKSPVEFSDAMAEYRLLLSIASITYTGAGSTVFPELSEYEVETTGDDTPVAAAAAYIRKQAVPTESALRMIGLAFGRFQRVLEKMEASADNPDFWPAIENAN